jgi:DNA polymerase-3 subunit delta
MTALKAHEVERFLIRPDLTDGIFLAYGPDAGLVSETATRLIAKLSGGGADKPEIIALDQATLDADPARLGVEARSNSLFGERRIIHLRGAGKSLAPTLEELASDLQLPIIIEAGNLAPRDALRAFAETSKVARALPCYADSDEAVSRLIADSFGKAGIRADAEAMAAIRDNLGNDRAITRSELDKLMLFAGPGGTITRDDVLALCADNGALLLDAVLDAAGTGHAENMERALDRALAARIDPQQLLTMSLNHFAQLRRWRMLVDAGQSARAVLDAAKPRPHFSRRGALEQQLRNWSQETLGAATDRILQGTADSRRQHELAAAITRRTFLALCYMAATP